MLFNKQNILKTLFLTQKYSIHSFLKHFLGACFVTDPYMKLSFVEQFISL